MGIAIADVRDFPFFQASVAVLRLGFSAAYNNLFRTFDASPFL